MSNFIEVRVYELGLDKNPRAHLPRIIDGRRCRRRRVSELARGEFMEIDRGFVSGRVEIKDARITWTRPRLADNLIRFGADPDELQCRWFED